ncbi:MAG: hypothetical protein GY708_14725 [Actinomycetia bacterium]|nr:hypothetical protein [Actinomycetes bacterium]MCP4961312.1 hypothetical protein [Actinomycetes bacterium]
MSLWTPDGEHEVPAGGGDIDPGQGEPELSQDQADQLEAELARAQAELIAAPVEQVVSNHVMGLFELAALHLRTGDLDKARLPIDAMGLLVDGLGDRLAEHQTLTAALTQLRMAYVEVSNAGNDEDEDDDSEV